MSQGATNTTTIVVQATVVTQGQGPVTPNRRARKFRAADLRFELATLLALRQRSSLGGENAAGEGITNPGSWVRPVGNHVAWPNGPHESSGCSCGGLCCCGPIWRQVDSAGRCYKLLARSCRLLPCSQASIHCVDVEAFWIEHSSDPSRNLIVFFVLRVGRASRKSS